MHKTCWYTTIHPLRVGAIVGSGGTVALGPLVRFGFHFGAAFQIRDDLLNLVGNERIYGKEILGDIYEGKRTLPLMHLMSNATGTDIALVRDYLARTRAERTPELVEQDPGADGRLRQHHLRGGVRRRHPPGGRGVFRGRVRRCRTGPRPGLSAVAGALCVGQVALAAGPLIWRS